MVITEAIILAGGLGTRLKDTVPDVPKCLAPVKGKPFLSYVLDHLIDEGITHFIFALGYKSDLVIDFICKEYPDILHKISVEKEPLGTGGAIRLACALAKEKTILVANGDTLFKIDVDELASFNTLSGANCTLSLKYLEKFDRYGVVEIDADCSITSFKEKAFYESGLVNGGMYALNVHKFLEEELPEKFSFENDYLAALFTNRRMFGIEQECYFIDIGIPEDYEKAQTELK